MRRFLCLLVVCLLLPACALGDGVRGYLKGVGYQYVTFGEYPYEADGTTAPLLWRVLIVDGDTAFLISQYIIDFLTYHFERDKDAENPLQYRDTLIRSTCSRLVLTMFSDEERMALLDMEDGRGYISVPTTAELQNPETGFSKGKYGEDRKRSAVGTPYAYEKGLKRIGKGGSSWYWTTDWRRLGFRWIVGDNGHISCCGIAREGGFRPVVYVDMQKITTLSGDGTLENPFVWAAADGVE